MNDRIFEIKNKACQVYPQYIIDIGKIVLFVYFDSFFIIERVGRKRIPHGILGSHFKKIDKNILPEALLIELNDITSSHKFEKSKWEILF